MFKFEVFVLSFESKLKFVVHLNAPHNIIRCIQVNPKLQTSIKNFNFEKNFNLKNKWLSNALFLLGESIGPYLFFEVEDFFEVEVFGRS